MADRQKERERRMREAQERARIRRENERARQQSELDAILNGMPSYKPSSTNISSRSRAEEKTERTKSAERRGKQKRVRHTSAKRASAAGAERRSTEKSSRRKRKRQMRPAAKAVLVMLILLAVIMCAGLSPLCSIQKINVDGNEKVTSEAIIQASAIISGHNLFTADLNAARERIYNLPWVSDVTVKRRIPSTVAITVTEGQVAGYLSLDGKLVSIDNTGKSIAVAEAAEGAPVFTGVVDAGFEIGQPVKAENEEVLKKALDYIGYFDRYRLENVTSVDVTVPNDVIFTIGDKLIIHFGKDDGIAYKMAYLKETLQNLPENANGVVDATRVDRLGKPDITYRPSVFDETAEPTPEASEPPENPYE